MYIIPIPNSDLKRRIEFRKDRMEPWKILLLIMIIIIIIAFTIMFGGDQDEHDDDDYDRAETEALVGRLIRA